MKARVKRAPETPAVAVHAVAIRGAAWIMAAWAAFALFSYLSVFDLHLEILSALIDATFDAHLFHSYALKLTTAFAISLFILWSALQSGGWIIKSICPDTPLSQAEWLGLGTAMGLGLFSQISFFLGALGAWRAPIFWTVLVALALLSFWHLRARPIAAPPLTPAFSGPWFRVWFAALLFIGCLFALGASAPEVFYDSLYYHLAIPNLFRIAHGFYNLPTTIYSNFALTPHMLYGLALTVGGYLSPKLLHVSTAVFLAILYIGFGQRFLSPGTGWLAAVLFLGMPVVGINAFTAGTDVAGSFWQMSSLYALVFATRDWNRGWLKVAGLLTGFAASCRYPSFVILPVASLLLFWESRKKQDRGTTLALIDVAHFLIPASLVLAPYLIRNFIYHGNPVYPFGGTHWGTPKIDMHIGNSSSWIPMLAICPTSSLAFPRSSNSFCTPGLSPCAAKAITIAWDRFI